MVSGPRTYLRIGGIWLLLSAVAHLTGHVLTFSTRIALHPELASSVDVLLGTPRGDEVWMLLKQFSLAFALFLVLAGTASVIASRRAVGARESRQWSGFAACFWVLTFGVFLLEPVAPGLIIAGMAAFFHTAAFFMAWDGDR